MSKIDWTEVALEIVNDYEYGEYTNGEIVSEWSEEREKEFAKDLLEFLVSVNGGSSWLNKKEIEWANALGVEL